MKRSLSIALGALMLSYTPVSAQMSEDGMLIFERYDGVSMPHFQEYFQLLKEKYEGTDAAGWGVYVASPREAYRLSAVPEGGMQGVLDVRALVATDRDDPDSVIGFWPRASVPLIGVAQDLGLLEWDSCSERAWNLAARRGSNHSRLQLISGRTG